MAAPASWSASSFFLNGEITKELYFCHRRRWGHRNEVIIWKLFFFLSFFLQFFRFRFFPRSLRRHFNGFRKRAMPRTDSWARCGRGRISVMKSKGDSNTPWRMPRPAVSRITLDGQTAAEGQSDPTYLSSGSRRVCIRFSFPLSRLPPPGQCGLLTRTCPDVT